PRATCPLARPPGRLRASPARPADWPCGRWRGPDRPTCTAGRASPARPCCGRPENRRPARYTDWRCSPCSVSSKYGRPPRQEGADALAMVTAFGIRKEILIVGFGQRRTLQQPLRLAFVDAGGQRRAARNAFGAGTRLGGHVG